MAMMITESCINCAVCVPECPNEAIVMGREERYRIRPGHCTQCYGVHDEPQCLKLCPIPDAVRYDPRRPETEDQLRRKSAGLKLAAALDNVAFPGTQ